MGNNKIPGSLPPVSPTQSTPEPDSPTPESPPLERSPSSASLDSLEYTSSASSIPETLSPLPPDPRDIAPTPQRAAIEEHYQLDEHAYQKTGTQQCWWLSCLDSLRYQGKLGDAFETGLFKDATIPVSDGEKVYGPKWQRVIMKHLNNQPKHDSWHSPKTNCINSDRQNQLERLVRMLDLKGVTICPSITPTPDNIKKQLQKLKDKQSVQVDKPEHAMSGVVKKIKVRLKRGKSKTRTVIEVYNHTTKKRFTVKVEGKGANSKLVGKEPGKGSTVINFITPFDIKDP